MEDLTPIVSVLLPVRAWRPTTSQAVESILTQTLRPIELLLIGQHDVEELRTRLPRDDRIITVPREQPGIVGALNTGLANARAPFIARMDDDDIAYPDRLATQLNYLQTSPEVQLCGSRIRMIDANGKTDGVGAGNRRYASWLNSLTHDAAIRQHCYVECPVPHPTLFAHRDIWRQLGGYRHFDGPEDYDLILRAMLQGVGMGKPSPVLQDWREHPGRLTHTDQRYRKVAFTRCRAQAAIHADSGLGLNDGRKVWLCGTGPNARDWYDELMQSGVSVEGFVDVHRNGPDRRKRNRPVIGYDELPTRRGDALIITAVTSPTARQALLSYFEHHHWQAGSDFILGA